MVISIGNWVLKAKDPNNLSEFVGQITLTDDWSRGILQPIDAKTLNAKGLEKFNLPHTS